MTHHRKHAGDERPWIVDCAVDDNGQAASAELLIDATGRTVSLSLPGGPTCWLRIGECDRLAHLVLLAANTASRQPRPPRPS